MVNFKMKIFKLYQVYGKAGEPLSDKKFLKAFDAKEFGDRLYKDFYIQEILFKSKDIWEVSEGVGGRKTT